MKRQSFAEAMAHKVGGYMMQILFLEEQNRIMREALTRIAGTGLDGHEAATVARLALLELSFPKPDDDGGDTP